MAETKKKTTKTATKAAAKKTAPAKAATGKKWTDEERSYLKRYAASKRLADLADRFDTQQAVVQAELDRLGLAAKDAPAATSRLGVEPLLEVYEQALQALHGGKKKKAEDLFEKVATECDQPELAERARQFLAICRRDSDGSATSPRTNDPFLAAVFEKNRGNLDRALQIASEHERDERFSYLTASIHALEGRYDDAARALRQAIEQNQKNRVYAFHDPDFADLRESEDHATLFGVA